MLMVSKADGGVEEDEEDTAEDRTQPRTLRPAWCCGGSRSQIDPA